MSAQGGTDSGVRMLGMRVETIGRTRCTVLLGTVDVTDRQDLRALARPAFPGPGGPVRRHRVLTGKLWRVDPAGAGLLVAAARAARERGEEWTWCGTLPAVAARLANLGEAEHLEGADPREPALAGWAFNRTG